MGRPIRIRPLLSSMLYAVRREATDETSASGEFDPSLVRKIGSVPPVASNRFWTSSGVIVQPAAATWQEEQDRPFVPRLWKNGLDRSGGLPSSMNVRSTPEGSGESIVDCWSRAGNPEASKAAAASAAATKDRDRRDGRYISVFPQSVPAQSGNSYGGP